MVPPRLGVLRKGVRDISIDCAACSAGPRRKGLPVTHATVFAAGRVVFGSSGPLSSSIQRKKNAQGETGGLLVQDVEVDRAVGVLQPDVALVQIDGVRVRGRGESRRECERKERRETGRGEHRSGRTFNRTSES